MPLWATHHIFSPYEITSSGAGPYLKVQTLLFYAQFGIPIIIPLISEIFQCLRVVNQISLKFHHLNSIDFITAERFPIGDAKDAAVASNAALLATALLVDAILVADAIINVIVLGAAAKTFALPFSSLMIILQSSKRG